MHFVAPLLVLVKIGDYLVLVFGKLTVKNSIVTSRNFNEPQKVTYSMLYGPSVDVEEVTYSMLWS